MITNARAVALAAQEAARIGDQPSIEMLALALSVMESMGNIARRLAFDEERVQALADERVDEELARYGIRRHLRAISG